MAGFVLGVVGGETFAFVANDDDAAAAAPVVGVVCAADIAAGSAEGEAETAD